MINRLIKQARDKYPNFIYYQGRLSESEKRVLEKACDVRSSTVYMDGSTMYSIKFKVKKFRGTM